MWLYLTKILNNEIVVASDFFEVNNKFGADAYADTRRIILDELLFFIHRYLLDNPKINGFYMNKLSHTWNKWNGHLDKYPLVDIFFKINWAALF